jgi:hypothetical protein
MRTGIVIAVLALALAAILGISRTAGAPESTPLAAAGAVLLPESGTAIAQPVPQFLDRITKKT